MPILNYTRGSSSSVWRSSGQNLPSDVAIEADWYEEYVVSRWGCRMDISVLRNKGKHAFGIVKT